jgi:hypothetical protein
MHMRVDYNVKEGARGTSVGRGRVLLHACWSAYPRTSSVLEAAVRHLVTGSDTHRTQGETCTWYCEQVVYGIIVGWIGVST